MKKSNLLVLLLLAQAIGVLLYTFFAYQHEGANLFQTFFSNIKSLNWNGQFNLDFSTYLTLSGLWIMWRNGFVPMSIFLGMVAMIMGIIFFAPYLVYLLLTEKGDFKKVLVGGRS